MSLIIHYQNGKLLRAEQTIKRNTPSPIVACSDGETYVMGEVFEATYENVAESNWMEEPDALNGFEGAISIVNVQKDKCVFATDLNGIETWYTYHKGDTFILSDNFWDIVRVIQPKYEDIDAKQARMFLISLSVDGNTLIKNLKIVQPFTIGRYNAQTNELEIRKYRQHKYSNEVTSVSDAVENMDKILDKAMKQIKRTCGDVRYGIGVSGGLDSRVIPHYAKKNGINLVGFNVCVPKPHGLFLARSCKNAQQIADVFDIPYTNVRWEPSTVEQKVMTSVQCYPLGIGRNSFKYEPNMPEFDVLLTGGSGLIVGSMLPTRINEYTREELIEEMLSFFNKQENGRTFRARAFRGLNYIFGTRLNGSSKSVITKLLHSEDIDTSRQTIIEFVDNGLKSGQTNIEVYEDFFSNVMGFYNRYGAFESIFGKKRSFSIYVPFMYKETLRWSPELLFDRKVLNELILQRVSEVKGIKSELFEPAPNQRISKWSKLTNMISFLVRGNGVATDDYWMKKRSVKKKLARRLDNGHKWFEQIFGKSTEELRTMIVKSKESQLMIDVWELKALVDSLESKEYLNWERR